MSMLTSQFYGNCFFCKTDDTTNNLFIKLNSEIVVLAEMLRRDSDNIINRLSCLIETETMGVVELVYPYLHESGKDTFKEVDKWFKEMAEQLKKEDYFFKSDTGRLKTIKDVMGLDGAVVTISDKILIKTDYGNIAGSFYPATRWVANGQPCVTLADAVKEIHSVKENHIRTIYTLFSRIV